MIKSIIIAISLVLITSFVYAKHDAIDKLKGQDKIEVELLNTDMPKIIKDLEKYRDRLVKQSEKNTNKEEKELLMGLAIEIHEVIEDIDEVMVWTGQMTHEEYRANDDILSP